MSPAYQIDTSGLWLDFIQLTAFLAIRSLVDHPYRNSRKVGMHVEPGRGLPRKN